MFKQRLRSFAFAAPDRRGPSNENDNKIPVTPRITGLINYALVATTTAGYCLNGTHAIRIKPQHQSCRAGFIMDSSVFFLKL
jgi:hypothetical protein